MIGVVLGNGPSKKMFNRVGDFVLGCNIPSQEFSVDATVICDEEIVWVLKNDFTLIQVPVIISTKVFEKMKELKIVEKFEILHVFKPKEWYNSAHYAAEYLIEYGCSEVHVWGCDSIFENDTKSETSKYTVQTTNADERFIKNWRRVWQEIHNSNGHIDFVVYRLDK
mgnify:CR=1 FL=1